MLSGSTVPPDSTETQVGSSNQEASPSAGKNSGLVLVPCRAWKCVPTAISDVVNISKVHSVICYNRWVLSEGHELTPYFSVFNLCLTQLWPYQKDVTQTVLNHTTLTLNFTNIQGQYSNFVECQSFFWFRQTRMTQLVLAISQWRFISL